MTVLIRDGFPDPPTLDTAVSSVLLRRVSEGSHPETLRLHRPARVAAFGPTDRHEPGYRDAISAASGRGFSAVERLAGGRAAVFHEGTIAFAWIVPDPTPRLGIRQRFAQIASVMVAAFRSLGVDARVGEVPGEYCPGEFSVNARGRTKLMGVGQRLVSHAAHVGGVVVVNDVDLTRDALVPIYAALGLDWDPETVGSVGSEMPGVTWERAERAIVDAFSARHPLEGAEMPSDVVDEARTIAARFEPGA